MVVVVVIVGYPLCLNDCSKFSCSRLLSTSHMRKSCVLSSQQWSTDSLCQAMADNVGCVKDEPGSDDDDLRAELNALKVVLISPGHGSDWSIITLRLYSSD